MQFELVKGRQASSERKLGNISVIEVGDGTCR